MATSSSIRGLPEKKYFKIGEVADLVGVEPHVLRYWETQFPQVRPHKARSGHRLYRRREVETLLVIRELLHVQRFTIAGARQALRQPGGAQSLLPRFFGAAAAPSTEEGEITLLPRPVHTDPDSTDPDGAPVRQRGAPTESDSAEGPFEAAGADSGEGDVIELEAEGLEDDALRAALSRESAERAAELEGRRTVVEVEVAAVDGDEDVEARAPAAARIGRLPVALPLPLGQGLRAPSPARRMLLEDALASARAVLAVLDREDERAHV